MRHLALASLALMLLSGCTANYWPDYGQGGAAERYPLPQDAAEGEAIGLLAELNLVRDRREWLRQAGAEDCMPGHVVKAQHLENRIAREIDGGLLGDGRLNLIRQRENLQVLEGRLQFLIETGKCLPSVLASDQEIAAERRMEDASQVAFDRLRVGEIGSSIDGHIAQANVRYSKHLQRESQRINQGRVLPADLANVSDIVSTSEQIDVEADFPNSLLFSETEFDQENL